MAKKPISAKAVARVRQEILDRTRMELPDELIREVIDSDPELRREILAGSGELDTEVRELFLEMLAQLLISGSWPLLGDPRRWSGRALKSIQKAVKGRGGRIHPPPPVTELSFAVELLAGGIRAVVPRGRIDGTNYTRFPEELLRSLAGKKGTWSGHRLILDFRAVEWAEVDQALYALTTSAQNVRFYTGAMVAIGVPKPVLDRLEELRPKMAAQTIPTLAASADEALRVLTT